LTENEQKEAKKRESDRFILYIFFKKSIE